VGVIVTSDGDWTGWQSHTEADATKVRGCTEETLQRYVKNPDFCPYCEQPVIEADRFDVEGRIAWQAVRCNECGAEWNDVYELVAVEKVEIPQPLDK
jgi:predicted Zn-ribbon and HTH transcriptional regulator